MIYKSTEGVTSCKDMEKRTKLHETSHHQPLLLVLQSPLVAPLDGGTAVLINGDRQEDIGGIAGGLPLVTHHVALVLDLRRGEVAVESLVVLELLGIPLGSFTRNLGAC